MDPFDLDRDEKWLAYLQTEEGKKTLEKKPEPTIVEMSLCERLRFDSWALEALNHTTTDSLGDKRGDKKPSL